MTFLDLSSEERGIVRKCLVAAVEGPFFPEWEFQTLMGFERAEIAALVKGWPEGGDPGELPDGLTGVVGNLIGYPHGCESVWSDFIPVEAGRLDEIHEKWRCSEKDTGEAEAFPARIHALLALNAPLGVVIRRGPSKRVATYLWNRETDEFTLGQWLKGRIYERRCDLSPDGKHLLYFAMNGYWETRAQGAWSAISRAPYLKALALFPKGDCWHGGGLWTDESTYWLNGAKDHSVHRDCKEFTRDKAFEPWVNYGGECPGVYYLRLFRDEWILSNPGDYGANPDLACFRKPLNDGWFLLKFAHSEINSAKGRGCYWDEHKLTHPESGRLLEFPDWEWAEKDGDRLVWATGGKLFSGVVSNDGPAGAKMLFDFSPMEYEKSKAPY